MKDKNFRTTLVIAGIGGIVFAIRIFKGSSEQADTFWATWFLFLSLIMLYGGVSGLLRYKNADGRH